MVISIGRKANKVVIDTGLFLVVYFRPTDMTRQVPRTGGTVVLGPILLAASFSAARLPQVKHPRLRSESAGSGSDHGPM